MGRRSEISHTIHATTLPELLAKAAEKYGSKTAMLALSKDANESFSYAELKTLAAKGASVLRSHGLKRGDRLVIYADNSAAWAWADWSAQVIGVITAPIFATSVQADVEFIVRDCGASLVIVGNPEQEKRASATGVPLLKLVDFEAQLRAAEPIADLDEQIAACKPDDLATLIYTSGTTGIPKGVMLDHRAFCHVCDAVHRNIPFGPEETFLTFLPMSHVYERVAGQCLPISLGSTIAYSKGLASLGAEMASVKPTVMLCVPRFLEATMDKVLDGARKAPPLRQKLFNLAYAQGVKRARGEFAPLAGVLDKIVCKKIRDKLGGNFLYFVSGGAALPRHVAEFYMAMGLTILQGYGLTETSAATCLNHPDRNKYWTAGEPLEVELKIAEDGEILVKGPTIMRGYYNNPEATAEVLDADGWFHTGDIGEFEGKHLKITDRKKDLFKLSNGKYIAPQPLENRIKESPLIQEVVIFGDGQEMVTALIVPNWELLREKVGDKTTPEETLADRDDVRALIKPEIDRVNKTVAPHELVKKFSLLAKPFSVDGGEITPTLKVKRRVVRERYADVLASMLR